jgi:2,3-dihydroxy-p-cumate/2,3-dihydroxybenzoate 3,4-dioxygenase
MSDSPEPVAPRPPRRIRRPGHLALAVPDVGRAADFYTRVVGLAEGERAGAVVYLRAQFEHHCLELHPLADRGAGRAEPLHFGWETDSDEDTEALRIMLRRAGVPVRDPADEPGRLGIAFHFRDSLGMWNEVYRAMDRVAALVPRGPAPALRQAHFTRMSPDPDADLAFYRAIGFRVSDWVPGVQSFLRCAPEHHNVGFLKFDRPLLHHHAYDVGSWDGIKVVLDRATMQGWTVEAGPVRHAAGNNVAVYLRDPGAVRVEFFCEMEPIGDDEDHDTRRQPVVFDLWRHSPPPPGFRD